MYQPKIIPKYESKDTEIAELRIRVQLLEAALEPLAQIADEFDASSLDEARPEWYSSGTKEYNPLEELYCGRGGKALIVMKDIFFARDAIEGTQSPTPGVDQTIAVVIRMYEASMPNIPWAAMSEERRQGIIANYRKLGFL